MLAIGEASVRMVETLLRATIAGIGRAMPVGRSRSGGGHTVWSTFLESGAWATIVGAPKRELWPRAHVLTRLTRRPLLYTGNIQGSIPCEGQ